MTLNPAQSRAVAHGSGPLLILAGAGTGKTRVLVDRYARLRREGIAAERLLLLTFTEKAAGELLDRIEREDRHPAAERWVTTYHAFALRLLQEEGWLLGLPKAFRIVSPVRKWELLREVLFELRPPSLFHPQRPHEQIPSILKLIERAKQELIGTAEFVAWAEAQPESDDPLLARQRELAQVYSTYQARILAQGLLDFDDTIFYSVRLLLEQPAAASRQAQRFAHIMVDEFQDTNFSQSRLLELLVALHRNLCVVGDDDQSIYKFRGASVANLRRFQKVFPDAVVVRLEENYRSCRPILQAAGNLIGEDSERLPKQLKPSRGDGPPIRVVRASGHLEEADAVASFIKAAIDSGTYRPKQIAVLARANAHLHNFARALQRRQVAYQISGGRGFFQQPEIKDCLAYFRAIESPDDAISVMRLLSLPRYAGDPVEAGRWARLARDQGRSIFEVVEGREEEGARRLTSDLRRFAALALRLGADELFYEVMEQTRYLDFERFAGRIEQMQVSANVQKLAELISAYCDEHTDHRLSAYLAHVALTDEAQADEEVASLDEALDAVHLMTVHQAKGLEFSLVVMPCLVEGRFPSQRQGEGFTLPDALLEEELPATEMHLAEERRLAYVAFTRAREELVCSLAARYEGTKEWRPSRFLDALNGVAAIEMPARELLGQVPPLELTILPGQVELPLSQPVPLAALSYTQVDTYLRCPQQYQYRFVFRLPTRPRPQAQFGWILHEALRDALGGIQTDEPLAWPAVEAAYAAAWARQRFCVPEQAPSLQELGREYLRRAYDKGDLKKPLVLEQPFSLPVDGFVVRGRIDRVDRHPDGTYEVIDYKTGSARRPVELQRDLQLGIYAMAAREVFRFEPLTLSYYYLETGDRVSVEKPADRLADDRETVSKVADGIRAEFFAPKPDRMKCAGCDFRLLCPSAV